MQTFGQPIEEHCPAPFDQTKFTRTAMGKLSRPVADRHAPAPVPALKTAAFTKLMLVLLGFSNVSTNCCSTAASACFSCSCFCRSSSFLLCAAGFFAPRLNAFILPMPDCGSRASDRR